MVPESDVSGMAEAEAWCTIQAVFLGKQHKHKVGTALETSCPPLSLKKFP